MTAPRAAVKRRTTCRICDATDLELLLDYGDMPLAGGFVPANDPRADLRFPLVLVRCAKCTLVQVLDQVNPELIFTEYSYASSTNRTLVRHFEQVAPELVALAGGPGKLVVEFGCNDGVLLKPLLASGAKVVGVDPSDVAARASAAGGWPLVQGYFGREIAQRVRAEHGPAQVVVGNNVFAHVEDLHALVEGVTTLLDERGAFAFEVHYQGDLLETVQFDTVYHEHVCYHSLTGLAALLGRHGLELIDVRRIPIHAGSIHVTAARQGQRPAAPAVGAMLAAEARWDARRFGERALVRRDTLRSLVEGLTKGGRTVVGYGAAGRATILLNFCGLGPDLVRSVSDLSPLRAGKVVPGVKTPVVPRAVFHESPPDYAILTAWNYEPEIVADEQSYLRRGGRFIIPLPDVRLVGAA